MIWLIAGALLGHFTKGFAPELLIEIPPYRRPHFRAVLKKLWMRMAGFLKEAVPVILAAVVAINVFYSLGILDFASRLAAPVVAGLWGLPREASTAVFIGFLRKDMAVAMLVPLALTAKQAMVAGTVLATFFPCAATFAVLFQELGIKDTLKAFGVMVVIALATGAALNLIL
jgi:ferrous iron transport protein B